MIQLKGNFENCAKNLVKINHRLAFVFSYERFGICANLHNFHRALRPIFNFPIFRKNGASLELLNIVFENGLLKGCFW